MNSNRPVDDLKKLGKVISLQGNQTVYWDVEPSVWFVSKGEVNLFAVPWEDGEITGKKDFLMTIKQGQLVAGIVNNHKLPLRLLMNGLSETELIQIDHQTLMGKNDRYIQLLFVEWENKLVLWMEQSQMLTEDTEEIERPVQQMIENTFLHKVHYHLQWSRKREFERLKRLSEVDQGKLEHSVQQLMETMKVKKEFTSKKVIDADENILNRTCQFIGGKSGISITAPLKKLPSNTNFEAQVMQIAKTSNIRVRQTRLTDNWWKQDNGALLGFLIEDERPVALIPKKHNQYVLHDLTTNEVKQVTNEVATGIAQLSFQFYRPFPSHKLNLWDLVKYSSKTHNIAKDVATFFVLGIVGGVLGLAIPMGVGKLIDSIIPEAERGTMIDFVFILVAIAIAMFTFQITRSLAMLRLEGRVDANVQAAVWDRVLNLPVPFFRKYTAGDLSLRVNSINSIRQKLSGTTLATIFTGVFSSTQFFLLFYYSKKLALIALVIVLVAVGITVAFGYVMVKNERQLASLNGKLTGLVFQIINGVAKFRVSGAEKRAFSLWSDHFSATRKVSFKTGMITNYFELFNAVYPILATIVLFYSVTTMVPVMTTGSFLAFYSAFAGFIASVMATSFSLITVLTIIPLYERAKPILETIPEVDEEKEEIEDLYGSIEVSHVDYKYDEEGSLILDDVSLQVQAGEFVAIVGTSGSGKSTLMRLLLGFDKPTSGSVYYDNQNLDGLNIQSVRNKLGVVLQGGQLLSGDIFTNIVGTSSLTMDDAWEAAKMAGLDQDIKNMPMGMFTIVDEGARTLSGGQRQRLMIARALVNRPKIIFFDEATSALDNRTQKTVSDSIEGLKATRIVIAHRLSTIMNADRIYVLDKGKMVEEGTFTELMERKGIFSNLAKRQMA